MKLKQVPSDFVVEEISAVVPKSSGDYALYLLHKTDLETFGLLNYLSMKNDVPVREFGLAGLKDRHAFTSQFFTLHKSFKLESQKEEKFEIIKLGYIDKPIRLGDLVGNRFKIVVRSIAKGDLNGLQDKLASMKSYGVPNYFDSQRFGSVFQGNFIMKYVMKGDFESALKLFLTSFQKSESKMVKDDKRRISENWQRLRKIDVDSQSLKKVLETYKKTCDWQKTYRSIPEALRGLFVSSYQSYLWNECAKLVFRDCLENKYLYTVDYDLGSLVFYKKLVERKPLLSFVQTISDELLSSGYERSVIDHILHREGISLDHFHIKASTGNFFKTHKRNLLVVPSALKMSAPEPDELNNNRLKVVLSFELPKSSYATIVTKRLFNH